MAVVATELVLSSIPTFIPLRHALRKYRSLLFMLYHMLKHFRRNEFVFLTAFLAITIIFRSISILFVEPTSPQATIVNFGDALWWSISTMTTVCVWRCLSCDQRRKGDRSNTDVCRDWNPLDICSSAVSSKLVAEMIEGKDDHDVFQSKVDAANQQLVMSPENYNTTAASKNLDERSTEKKGGPNNDALIDLVDSLRKLDQKDYDALIEIITTLKRDDDKKRITEKEKG